MSNKTPFANWPFHPAKTPFYYGWAIIVLGTLGICMSIPGQTMGVSTFTDSLIEALGMSRSELGFAYMCGTITSASALTWVGIKYDQHGVRPIAILASIGMALTLIFLSQTELIQSYLPGFLEGRVGNFLIMYVGFASLRFTGQGALTLVSRNMMMKWFEKRRGFAMGFSNVVTSLTFSSAPVFFEMLIMDYGWKDAWMILSVIAGLGFPLIVLFLFRDDPEKSGLRPDGNYIEKKSKTSRFPVVKQYNLHETMSSFPFWVFAMMLAMQAFYWTGFTFNVVSLFETADYSRSTAVSIFVPSSVIAVLVTLSVSSLSDFIKLKYLLYVSGVGSLIATIGMIYLDNSPWMIYVMISGNGILLGLYGVFLSVVWPRFYGTEYLGAISGRAMTLVVLGSSVGPIIFSESLSRNGNYDAAGWLCFAIFLLLTIAGFWADNPQERFRTK
ncbi:Major Facilitator Superfamily protein [Reichenbachiella faecimaris]|uniref:Major Facilitator Superfamily protein n=1 Tax=Reichenbachiella faecimaris TaxID=692418 RepID=A0A1W2GNP9_REIFA|nr:MFS transporter [Reichenbachiella faecimaris]SMD38204.1 Major Facilitator Superfamily protein [Reichenbachiella faecimaris]